MKLTLYEMETTINYNQKDKTASIYTCDKGLMTKLENLRKKDKRIVLDVEDELSKTYIVPKSAIKVRMPAILSDEKRTELKLRALKNFHNK